MSKYSESFKPPGGSALPPLPPHDHLENCQYWKVFGN